MSPRPVPWNDRTGTDAAADVLREWLWGMLMGEVPVCRLRFDDRPAGAEYCRWRGWEDGTERSFNSQSWRVEQHKGVPTRPGRLEAGSIPKAAFDAGRFDGVTLEVSIWPVAWALMVFQ